MHSESTDDVFLLWFSLLKEDPKRKNWQEKFTRRLKFGSALSTDWSTLMEGGCNAEVLYALLWEVTSAAQDIISDYRKRVKASKRGTHKALATLSASMNRTSAEIAKHLKLLNQLYGSVLEQRKRLLLSAPGANPLNKPSRSHDPIECKSELAKDFAALYDPAYLAEQLCMG
jgi:hypothetical protein